MKIGDEFTLSGRRYRCTDVGTRTIVAIQIDQVVVLQRASRVVLTHDQADAEGWFNGPPYAVAEYVFDENDIKAIYKL